MNTNQYRMNRKPSIPGLLIFLLIIAGSYRGLYGQAVLISLEEALTLAKDHYAGIERDELSVQQQRELAAAGYMPQPTQIYLSGDEFLPGSQWGVQALNLQQNFYLPKVSEVQRRYYERGAFVAEKQLSVTEQKVIRGVTLAYQRVQYATEALNLAVENSALYQSFLELATALLESGETGKIPQMSARTRLGQARLEERHAEEQYQIALDQFNQWLPPGNRYEVRGTLSLNPAPRVDTSLQHSPHLEIIRAREEMARAQVATQEAKLLPQINSRLSLQEAFGNFPLFGYQIGVNVPLFRKSYDQRIEAAKVGVEIQKASLKNERQDIRRITSELVARIAHQREVLEYLQQELQPLVEEQGATTLAAFREGETIYLEYLDSLEQIIRVKEQVLEEVYTLNVLQVTLNYWLGQ
jgi:heavy metal efflux system protein